MADLTIHELQNETSTPANDDYLALDGATAGTRKTLSSTFAAWIHSLWAAFINAITPLKTSFANGDKFPVVNGSTATAMEASKLLELTAQNALAGNVAPAFDQTKPNDEGGYAYYKNEIVAYNGATYRFKVNHSSGDWNSAEVERYDASTVLKFSVVTSNPEYIYAITDISDVLLFGIKSDGSVEWQVGIPSPIKTFIESFIDTLNSQISGLEENKVDKVLGKSLTPNILANNVFSSDNVEYSMVMLDASEKFLFGIRKDGSIDSLIFEDFIENVLNNKFKVVSQSYVDEKVLTEKNRATTVENDLQTQINNINPTIVEGGENNPDEVYLTAINDAITLKNTSGGVYGKKVVYVRPDDVLASILVNTDTIYVFKFGKEIGQNTLVIPERCVLVFDGGYLYGGTIQGTDTRIIYKNAVFASDVIITGTWDIPYIRSDILVDVASDNALKKINALQSDSKFNVVHILSGNYVFNPVISSDCLLRPMSSTKMIIDGTITVKENGFTHYFVVLIQNVDNVEVLGNGELIGDTDNHHYDEDPNSTHEHCHGIYCHVSNRPSGGNHGHYYIHDMKINGFPGDAVDVYGSDVVIRNLKIHHCGRQGISVEDSRRVLIENVDISDIYRTAPKAGIDIEPWLESARDVTIRNVSLKKCYGLMTHKDVENVLMSNVSMDDVSEIFSCTGNIKNVCLENISAATNQAPLMSVSAGADVRMSNVKLSSAAQGNIDVSNILVLLNCVFDNLTVTGSPKKGSIMYDDVNNRYLQYNGNSWINF